MSAPSATGAALIRAMTPRMGQTLDGMLAGQSEKQIATRLGISQHTLHVYVKRVYRLYKVNSRGELLALWIKRGRINGASAKPKSRSLHLDSLVRKRNELVQELRQLDQHIAAMNEAGSFS